MRNVFAYLLALIKYLLLSGVIAVIVRFFFPAAGLVVGGLMILGSVVAAAGEVKKANTERGGRLLAEEWKGFDEQLTLTSRSMH